MRIRTGSFAFKMTMVALLASAMAAATLMATFVTFDFVSSRDRLRNGLTTLADIVGQNSTAALTFEDRAAAVEVLDALRAEPPVECACLYDLSGYLFAQYQRPPESSSCAPRLDLLPAAGPGYSSVTRRVERHGEFQGTLYLKSDLQDFKKRWRHVLHVTGVLLLVALLVGGLSGLVLQRRISKPVRELAGAMHEVTEQHNFSIRVAVSGQDQVAQLGAGFNTMLAELEKRDLEKRRAETRLQYQALNDELTGLPNRRLLADRLSHALAAAKRESRQVALLYVDLDGFKLVNDSLGHPIGDLLLSQVGERLRSRVRQADTLARLGGDEFSVVLTGLSAKEQAGVVAASLLEVLASPFTIESHEITISASIGVSFFPANGSNAEVLLQQADSAMYAAKRCGKNRFMYFTEDLGVSVRERLNLENQLRAAIAHGEIRVHYQPEFEAVSGRLTRFEALARWTHATLGVIPPGKFIPIAEETGLILPLGAYVMERACAEAVTWQAAASHSVQVAVNVSSLQFTRDTFVEEVAEVLRRTGLAPNLLQLELTESVMLSGASRAAETMNRLRALGITLAIDDFGTGYSCLSYLSKLPFDALKIDRSFVLDLERKPEAKAMVDSLVTLAHNLGMRVIVEGIETQEQLEVMTEIGSNEMQGYLLGRPTPDPISLLQARDSARAALLTDPSRRKASSPTRN
jgi:diguanylate cyclase (GGDEF)-like protein